MEAIIRVPQGPERVTMLGLGDRNLKIIREALGVHVTAREGIARVRGEPETVAAARFVLEKLADAAGREVHLSRQAVLDLIGEASSAHARGELPPPGGDGADPAWNGRLNVYAGGQPVQSRTPNQQAYLDAIRDNDLVFGIGPAGTGKTYLAVAAATHMLKADRAKKIILVRPAVEAGERLGFLPGDFQAKVNPYLRPLLDALHDMMDFPTLKRFLASDVVEIVPLAYMRGRTLNRAVIILDEAQNATRGQMQMFLTRMGHGSKMIVTGDITQIDLPDPQQSGLVDAVRRLGRTRGVSVVAMDERDIVRHPLVQRIVEAYALAPPPQGDNPALDVLRPAAGASEGGGVGR